MRRRVLVYAPSPFGGLAEHVHYQARELVARGFEVQVLCRPGFRRMKGGSTAYRRDERLLGILGPGLLARVGRAACTVINQYILAWRVARLRPDFVLLEANSEFYAAAWFLPHWLLKLAGMIYVTNFHDPVRGPEKGLRWPHAVNIRLAYASLAGGLIHGSPPARAYLPARLIIQQAPFGVFEDLTLGEAPFDLRGRLGIPADMFVVLAFGHIADRKNLDLVIEALADLPGVQLVVAGQVNSAGDRPAEYYADVARRADVADRVHFSPDFIPEGDIPAYFLAADAVALTYERQFVSQSGVLQIAALYDKPVLASGGDGPLRDTVERFGLGVTVEPDSAAAITGGLQRLMAERLDRSANFTAYRATMSWAANVDRLLEVVAAAKAIAHSR